MRVEIVGLQGKVFSTEAGLVILPTQTGEIGVLSGHTHLVGQIRSGFLKVKNALNGEELFSVFAAGGVFEVQPKSIVVMLDVFSRADADNNQSLVEMANAIQQERAARLDFDRVQHDLNETLVRAEAFYKMKKGA